MSCRSARWSDACIETPGHTAGHISYWFKEDKLAFVGDTLFSVGCGRILEGNPEMMWQSLLKIRNLPADTRSLLRPRIHRRERAISRSPSSRRILRCARAPRKSCELVEQKRPTIPTTIQQEKSYNPFLRADLHSVAGAIGMEGAPPAQVFAAIRARKDKF